MDPISAALLGAVAIAAVVGLGAAVKRLGLRAVAHGVAQQLLSIRAIDVWGTGIRMLGVRHGPGADRSTATMWVTLCFLPVVPFARRVVRFVEPGMHEARWIVVEATPLDRREIARTYLFGWIVFPLLIIGPFVIGG